MPSGMITIDPGATFATMLLMSISEKTKFGTDIPDVSATGERKYTVECAVTYHAEPGMRPVSEVLPITLTGGDHAQVMGLQPGTQVAFHRIRAGVSQPEKRDNGRISGGRLWYSASGIRPVGQAQKAA